MERGKSFGIAPNIYHLLAQAAISAEELAQIAPQVLTPHQDGRPGAILFLWGQEMEFFVSVDCSIDPPEVQLSACGEDEPEKFRLSRRNRGRPAMPACRDRSSSALFRLPRS
jgi:hypothetical protein